MRSEHLAAAAEEVAVVEGMLVVRQGPRQVDGTADTVGTGSDVARATVAEPETAAVVEELVQLELAAVAFGLRPRSIEPTQPSWLVVVDLAVLPGLQLEDTVQRWGRMLPLVVEAEEHTQPLAGENWSTVEAILRCYY